MRQLPWAELVGAIGEARFEEIRAALEVTGIDPANRDAFLLNAAPGQLLRDLMPPDAPAELINGYASLIHSLYLCWSAGWPVATLDDATVRASLTLPLSHSPTLPLVYLQLPERLVWAQTSEGTPHEPLDGIFVVGKATPPYALAILGFRPDREGFTTVEAPLSPVPRPLSPRPDGSPSFANLLPAGDFLSVADKQELATLAILLAPRPADGAGLD